MNNKKNLTLSSKWTNVGLYGGTILLLAIIPLLYSVMQDQEFHMGMLIAGLVLMGLIGFIVYQFLYVCKAQVIDDKLVLKKQFKPATVYTFDKIGGVSAFYIKRTKYINLKMENQDSSIEKYLIINSYALLSFENKDAEETLINLRTETLK